MIKRDKNKLYIGKVKITASRFSWQRRTGMALLSDPKTESAGTKSVYIELLVGAISISWYPERKSA
jgi:hypothetical protein